MEEKLERSNNYLIYMEIRHFTWHPDFQEFSENVTKMHIFFC